MTGIGNTIDHEDSCVRNTQSMGSGVPLTRIRHQLVCYDRESSTISPEMTRNISSSGTLAVRFTMIRDSVCLRAIDHLSMGSGVPVIRIHLRLVRWSTEH